VLRSGCHGHRQLCSRAGQREFHHISAGRIRCPCRCFAPALTDSQGSISGLVFALSVVDASQYAAGALAHLSHHSMQNQEFIGRQPGIMQRIAALLGDGNVDTLRFCVLALANLGCAAVNQEKMAATPGLVAQVGAGLAAEFFLEFLTHLLYRQFFKVAESENQECAMHAVRALANVAFCPPGHDAIFSEPDSLEVHSVLAFAVAFNSRFQLQFYDSKPLGSNVSHHLCCCRALPASCAACTPMCRGMQR